MRIAVLICFALLTGCSGRYAQVYITTVDDVSQVNNASQIYNAADGRLLGESPLNCVIKKSSAHDNLLRIYAEPDCFTAALRIYRIPRWFRTKSEAQLVENMYKYQIPVKKINGCN